MELKQWDKLPSCFLYSHCQVATECLWGCHSVGTVTMWLLLSHCRVIAAIAVLLLCYYCICDCLSVHHLLTVYHSVHFRHCLVNVAIQDIFSEANLYLSLHPLCPSLFLSVHLSGDQFHHALHREALRSPGWTDGESRSFRTFCVPGWRVGEEDAKGGGEVCQNQC